MTSSVPVPPLRDSAASAFELPPLVRVLASKLPAFPPAAACALALTLVAPRVLGRETLTEFVGKSFRIVVRDAGVTVAFRVGRTVFEPLGAGPAVDVTFTASAVDFLRLATRRVDPDTLFFDRRLLIEGDTETGLRLKNILDAVEVPRWLSGG